MKICLNGHPMEDGDKFCGICGAVPQSPAPDFVPQQSANPYGQPVSPVQPTPVQPNPAPVSYGQPMNPTQPTPVQPTPVQPTPVQPNPAPVSYGQPMNPTQPTPVQPNPVQPNPAPVSYGQPMNPTQPTGNPYTNPYANPSATPVQPAGNPYGQPTSFGNAGTTPTYQNAEPQKKKGLPVGALIGIIAGGVVIIAIIVVLIIVVINNKKNSTYTVNSEEYQYSEQAEEGYKVCDTSIAGYLDTSFLYPSECEEEEIDDVVYIYPVSESGYEEYIEIDGKYGEMGNLKKYFKNYVSELEAEGFDIDQEGDIQVSTVGDKTVYRYACDVSIDGYELQANRYVEIYEDYYYEYTVVSEDGSEGTLKEIIGSLYPNSGAWIEYVEEVTEEPEDYGTDESGTVDNGTDDNGTDDYNPSYYSFSDGSMAVYPQSIVYSAEDRDNEVLMYFGNDDVVQVYPMTSASAEEGLEALQQDIYDNMGTDGITLGEIYTYTSDYGDVWYYQNAYCAEQDFHIIIASMSTANGTWGIWCCADQSNKDQAAELVEYVMYNSLLF